MIIAGNRFTFLAFFYDILVHAMTFLFMSYSIFALLVSVYYERVMMIKFSTNVLNIPHVLRLTLIYHCIHQHQEGEPVEFEIVEEDNGRRKAQGVTGPDGAYVQGAPRRNSFDGYQGNDNDDFRF